MDNLYHRSIAAGIPHEVALRDQHADDIRRFEVNEGYQYAASQEPQEPIQYADRRGV